MRRCCAGSICRRDRRGVGRTGFSSMGEVYPNVRRIVSNRFLFRVYFRVEEYASSFQPYSTAVAPCDLAAAEYVTDDPCNDVVHRYPDLLG
jgi:hypothetical protein